MSNKMQHYTAYFIWKLVYMLRVVPSPIIRSSNNCFYSIWYLSRRYCYLPLSWKSWNWFECAVGGVRHPQHTHSLTAWESLRCGSSVRGVNVTTYLELMLRINDKVFVGFCLLITSTGFPLGFGDLFQRTKSNVQANAEGCSKTAEYLLFYCTYRHQCTALIGISLLH